MPFDLLFHTSPYSLRSHNSPKLCIENRLFSDLFSSRTVGLPAAEPRARLGRLRRWEIKLPTHHPPPHQPARARVFPPGGASRPSPVGGASTWRACPEAELPRPRSREGSCPCGGAARVSREGLFPCSGAASISPRVPRAVFELSTVLFWTVGRRSTVEPHSGHELATEHTPPHRRAPRLT